MMECMDVSQSECTVCAKMIAIAWETSDGNKRREAKEELVTVSMSYWSRQTSSLSELRQVAMEFSATMITEANMT